jgi:hypothetical protein
MPITKRQAPEKTPHVRRLIRFDRQKAYPLLHCRSTKSNGEIKEVALGPCVATMFKWAVIGLISLALAMGGVNSSQVVALLRLLRFL